VANAQVLHGLPTDGPGSKVLFVPVTHLHCLISAVIQEVELAVMETEETEFAPMDSAARDGDGAELHPLIVVGVLGLPQSSVIGLYVPLVLNAVTGVAVVNTRVAS